MKKEYSTLPESMKEFETYGFSWMEFVCSIPTPIVVATSYKSNGKTNACMQSWMCFSSSDEKFYAILSSVSKYGHLYQSVKEKGEVVLNFPSEDIYDKCYSTIANNGFDNNEIEMSGLTVEKATLIDAPRIKECFLNLECCYKWEKELFEGSSCVLLCLEVVNVCMDTVHMSEKNLGRYGKSGYLYNVHSPFNPENPNEISETYIAVLEKYRKTE